jgi:hypothetical protein
LNAAAVFGVTQATARAAVKQALATGGTIEVSVLESATSGDPPGDRIALKEQWLLGGRLTRDGRPIGMHAAKDSLGGTGSSATRAIVEPHAAALEACSAAMQAAGIGLHPTTGHVGLVRRLADSMRADAAQGKLPHAFNGGI